MEDGLETRLFRDALRSALHELSGSVSERTRIEGELAQMLRDEAEEQRIDCADPEQVSTWVDQQHSRLASMMSDLEQDLKTPPPAPVVGQQYLTTEGNFMKNLLGGLATDLRMAVRSLRKKPGMTAVILATLTLGIGLNSAVFSVLNSVLLKPMVVEDSSSLIKLFTSVPRGFLPEEPMAFPDVLDLRETDAIIDIATQCMTITALSVGNDSAEITVAEMASDNLFELLGVKPRLGRLFQSAGGSGRQALVGNERDVAVLSAAAWARRFDSDPEVLGQVIRLNGHPLEIIGVVPSGYRGVARGLEPELWVPLETGLRIGITPATNTGNQTEDSLIDDRGHRSMWVVARTAPGVTVAQATAELENAASGLRAQYPETNKDRELRVIAYNKVKVIPSIDTSLNTATWVLLGVVFLVLLIASTNLANLLLARAVGRRGEMATRLSLGASRARIVRQLLVESLVLGTLGAIGGLIVAFGASKLVSQFRLELMVPLQLSVELDARVVLFTILVALFTSAVFGLAPAFEASRTSLLETIKESSSRGGKRLRIQSTMVTAQVAFSVVLLIFAGLAVRSIINASKIDVGFESNGVAGLIVAPESQGYDTDRLRSFYLRLKEELESEPGVSQVTLASHVPLNLAINTTNATPIDQITDDPDKWPEVDTASVDESYFDVLRIPVLRGRAFERDDRIRDRNRRAVVINETLAQQFFGSDDPIGRQVSTNPERDPFTVVGVVRNGKYRTLGEAPRPFLYFALSDAPFMVVALARFDRDDQVSALPVQEAVRALDPDLAVTSVGTLEEMTSLSLLIPKAAVSLFGALGLIGLLISAIGLFGVLSYSVSQRTHEIGLRVAIGATPRDVLGLVARRGFTLALIGIALGSAVAFASTRFLSAILYGVSATDKVSFIGGGAILLSVAVIASLAPARAALGVSPTEALRYE